MLAPLRHLARAASPSPLHTALAAALALAACADHATTAPVSCEGYEAWPSAPLPASAAATVDPAQFLSATQLQSWAEELDARGLRATATAAHDAYIDELAHRLACAGVADVRVEEATFPRWSVGDWSLAIASGASAGPVEAAAYIAYSGTTPADGITAPLYYLAPGAKLDGVDVSGKIVLFDMKQLDIPMTVFRAVAMHFYDPDEELGASYSRPYLNDLAPRLDEVKAAGAAGAIAILPAPLEAARGSYLLFDGEVRDLPGVLVDRALGAELAGQADGVTEVTLTLPATVEEVATRNLLAFIPGMSDELTVLHSHTDGTNALEDNGPDAMIAMAQYLARLPKAALPRTVLVLFGTGHFAGGVGVEGFLDKHADDGLVARIASVLTVEHLGAEEWLPNADGQLEATGRREVGAFFQPKITPLVEASYAALLAAEAKPAAVLPPVNLNGGDAEWPGDGQYFWKLGRLPTANYITGPYYLLSHGVSAADKIDFAHMRAELVAFTQMLLDLSRVPKADLAPAATP